MVLTGTAERQQEARNAAHSFMPGADLTVELSRPARGTAARRVGQVKEILEDVARSCSPDVIVAPSSGDAHQDHRTIAEIVPTVFRDQLYLAYEIPKWDGDIGRPSVYVPLSASTAQRKVELLHKCYPSQRGRDWWDDEVFLGLARLRGMECRAPYAEAFGCAKMVYSRALHSGEQQGRPGPRPDVSGAGFPGLMGVCAAHDPASIRQVVELMPLYQRAREPGCRAGIRGRPVRSAIRARG